MQADYDRIVSHYESCLEKYGDTHQGVDWPKLEDALKRYQVMTEIELYSPIKRNRYSLLDFGCGAGHLLDYLNKNKLKQFEYSGCDLSRKFIDLCKSKFSQTQFLQFDAIKEPFKMLNYDFIIMNGVFTEKRELSFDEMWNYVKTLLDIVSKKSNIGVAFNVMSKHVQWERDDLFHLPHDLLADYLTKHISRDYIIRNDYGLYEYTVYVYKTK